jgi:NAD(P)-dependent dehydrogenase (short-subunit alcohol dehydrogenase family)
VARELEGRSALVAGANQGLGREIARALVREGASLVVCARDARLLEEARAELAALAGPAQKVVARPCDVSRAPEVEGLLAGALAECPDLDVIVNCAGIYGPKGLVEENDWAEWVRTVEVNLLGAVLLTRAALPHLRARGYGKIVHLSGGGATAPLPRLSAYAASKAGLVRFVETLAQELEGTRIDVNAVAPGALNTRMLDEALAAGPERVGEAFYRKMLEQKAKGGVPLERGAALAVFLASRRSDGITGRLLSAVWDPWSELPAHRDELARSDVYTLRRVMPKDRGKDWGGRE